MCGKCCSIICRICSTCSSVSLSSLSSIILNKRLIDMKLFCYFLFTSCISKAIIGGELININFSFLFKLKASKSFKHCWMASGVCWEQGVFSKYLSVCKILKLTKNYKLNNYNTS
jgi:hypothetical protein